MSEGLSADVIVMVSVRVSESTSDSVIMSMSVTVCSSVSKGVNVSNGVKERMTVSIGVRAVVSGKADVSVAAHVSMKMGAFLNVSLLVSADVGMRTTVRACGSVGDRSLFRDRACDCASARASARSNAFAFQCWCEHSCVPESYYELWCGWLCECWYE